LIQDFPNLTKYIISALFSIGVAFFILVSTFNGNYVLGGYEAVLYASLIIANFITAGWQISMAVQKYMIFQIMLREKKFEA